ncbi:hypothetical protein [Crenothrix polyspora]|uniref:Collagen triple helix repeat protein n=1 Tax=Crenothrix polyspora TaxID=360316 RepID=A0A1R4H0I8_9GAMM|nr:hypothetical protein [Crenothrix polyspora]SJM89741.1 Collagen triple helix repeat protein [Crenothrix polyspora]
MNRSLLISALLATFVLTACDNKPTVINAPAGPAGPAGAKGATGNEGVQGSQGKAGAKGETGTSGESTTVIVTPPAEPTK